MLLNKAIIKILRKISNNILEKSNLDMKKIGNLIENLQTTIDFLKIYNVIFIPFIGEIGSGKSTIINGIIGEDVLPIGDNECTKRGIVIRYLGKNESEINIRKTYFKEEKLVEKTNYYIETEDYIIGKGLEQVRGILNDLNHNNIEKEEDSFYYIRTKIKLFDDFGLDDSLKRMIYLIDLPGFGTENVFEKNIFLKFMSISHCFAFVVKNTIIKEKKKQEILRKIFEQAKEKKHILTSKLLQSSLFIINIFNEQKTKLNDKEQAKKDIIKIIKGFYKKDEEEIKDVNLCFFHAKNYSNFCNDYNYFYNVKDSIKSEFRNFLKKNREIFLSPENTNTKKYKSFCLFLISQLDTKMKKLSIKNKCNYKKEIEKDLNKLFQILNISMKEQLDNSNIICKKFSLGQENINTLNSLKNSNFENLKDNVESQIKALNKDLQTDLEIKLDNAIEVLDIFFSSNFSEEKDFEAVELFTKQTNEIKERLLKFYSETQIKYFDIIEEYKIKIKDSLTNKKDNIEIYLKEQKFINIVREIDNEIKTNLDDLNKKIENLLENIYLETDKINKQIVESITNFPYIIKFKKPQSFKYFFSKNVGRKGGNLTKEIIDEIKISSLSLYKIHEEKGFIDWLYFIFSKAKYFQNSIDIILNSFVDKINYAFTLLIEQITKYTVKLYREFESIYEKSTHKYTQEQQKFLNELKVEYEEKKYKIIEYKKKLLNKDESQKIS